MILTETKIPFIQSGLVVRSNPIMVLLKMDCSKLKRSHAFQFFEIFNEIGSIIKAECIGNLVHIHIRMQNVALGLQDQLIRNVLTGAFGSMLSAGCIEVLGRSIQQSGILADFMQFRAFERQQV